MATSYARIKHRILTVMGDEEGGAVMKYIDALRDSSNKKAMEDNPNELDSTSFRDVESHIFSTLTDTED